MFQVLFSQQAHLPQTRILSNNEWFHQPIALTVLCDLAWETWNTGSKGTFLEALQGYGNIWPPCVSSGDGFP